MEQLDHFGCRRWARDGVGQHHEAGRIRTEGLSHARVAREDRFG
jgi:hypothetical protein